MKNAFSLVELSIVLVILGLLVGGVLSGQSLIHAAELRAVSAEYARYKTATHSFRDKYFALPGDLANAQAFWGVAANCPGTNANTPAPASGTCNGDGDGVLKSNAGTSNETLRYWQHLALAQLIEGTYTGVSADSTYMNLTASLSTPNVPRSKLNSAGWSAVYEGAGGWTYGPGATAGFAYMNEYWFGAPADSYGSHNPVLKGEDAWNIDTKMDDGVSNNGGIRSIKWYSGGTTSTCADNSTGAYSVSATGIICTLAFKMGA